MVTTCFRYFQSISVRTTYVEELLLEHFKFWQKNEIDFEKNSCCVHVPALPLFLLVFPNFLQVLLIYCLLKPPNTRVIWKCETNDCNTNTFISQNLKQISAQFELHRKNRDCNILIWKLDFFYRTYIIIRLGIFYIIFE